MKPNNLRNILLLVLLVGIILGGISYATQSNDQTVDTERSNEAVVESSHAVLVVKDLYANERISIDEGETVLAMLERLNETNPNVQLTTKDYGELGVLVEALGGRVNGTDNQYWQYTVNGTAPMIGVDAYELKNGDTVVWEFKASEF